MKAEDDFLVTFDHLHTVPGLSPRPGYCHRGARMLCNRHGIDWTAALNRGGVMASVLLATGEAQALALVEYAREVKRGQ